MAKITMQGKGDIEEVSSYLNDVIQSSGISCELVGSSKRDMGESKVVLLVFEKYYMRASNRASLSVMITEHNESIFVDAIGAGGGQGPIFKFSWGTEESFVNVVQRALSQKGFY